MKKLSKLKLNSFMASSLSEDEMNMLKGGCVCSCGCLYSGSGGSSSTSNSNANLKTGSHSEYSIWCYTEEEGWKNMGTYAPRGSDWDFM